jgi:outer membrane biosynthesis protein TonB
VVTDIKPTPVPPSESGPQMPSFSLNNLYPGMNQTSAETPQSQPQSQSHPQSQSQSQPQSQPQPIPQPIPEPIPQPIPEPIPEPGSEPGPQPSPEPPKSPRKEVAEIKKDEFDDTDSLAGFLNDVKQIVEDKGVKVDTSNSGMVTLFEDASEVEKTS